MGIELIEREPKTLGVMYPGAMILPNDEDGWNVKIDHSPDGTLLAYVIEPHKKELVVSYYLEPKDFAKEALRLGKEKCLPRCLKSRRA